MNKHIVNLITYFLIIPVLFIAFIISPAYSQDNYKATELQFQQIWDKIRANSPSQKAAIFEAEAADISGKRSARHWFPTIYADVKGYATNDPGMTFMSNLGQSSITQNDFNPDTLNNPGTDFYQKGSIGLDLPLYEGGAKVEAAKSMKKIADAKNFQKKFIEINEFSAAASAYGRIIVSMKIRDELNAISGRVDAVLSNYQGRLRSNPVEYSGILSLKTLRNKIKVHLSENESKASSLRLYLEKMAGNSLPDGWLPSGKDIISFSDSYLKSENLTADESFGVRAYKSIADSAADRAEAAKAVFLPKVGLFAESSIYNGKRDTSDSYTAGFYIRMNILSPMDYGAVKQAELESDASKSLAEDAKLKGEIELGRLYTFSDILKKNISVMQENSGLMNEQMTNSLKLFGNGSIKTFQLADVFSGKTDLIINLASAEEEYLSVMAGIYNYSIKDVKGVKHGEK